MVTAEEGRKLPEGWKWVRLNQLGVVLDGDWILNTDYTSTGVRLIQVGDVGNGRFIGKSSRFITLERAEELNCTFLKPGDILISRLPEPIGRACLLPKLDYPCITAVDVSIWRPNEEIITREYAVYYLNSSEWFERVKIRASGATRPRISRSNLENLEIPLPPLSEQKRIAAILKEQMAAVEKAKAAAEAQLEAAKALPAAYLREVFPQDKERKMPEGWKWVRLGEVIIEAKPGFACGERDFKGVIQLRMNNVNTTGGFDWTSYIRVPNSRDNFSDYFLKPGDVLFNNTNSAELVGKSALFEGFNEPVVYSNHFTRIRTKETELYSGYLAYWLQSLWQRGFFAEICNRWIGQSAVQRDKLLRVEIPLSPLPEQKRIAAFLKEKMAAVEKLRKALEEQLDTINKLPEVLLRQAFRGEL